ncbi:MAG: hypothetical protein LBJ61_08980 [Deltaproteobacteria bacterium]|nr:hypothetical protein [Deltaproteobacteria bacterium]
MPTNKVLDYYYTRQQIEQVFELSKNNGCLTPLIEHSAECINGRLLISFIVSIINIFINIKLNNTKYCAESVMFYMRSLYINKYSKTSIIEVPTKQENDIISLLNLQTDFFIQTSKFNDPKLLSIANRRQPGRPKNTLGEQVKPKNTELPSTELAIPVDLKPLSDFGESSSLQSKRTRGRPPGSKNKPKPL